MKAIVILMLIMLVGNVAFALWAFWISRGKRNGPGGQGGCGHNPQPGKRKRSALPDETADCSCFADKNLDQGLPPDSNKFFLILPYLQLGGAHGGPSSGSLEIHFSVPNLREGDFTLEVERTLPEGDETSSAAASIAAPAVEVLPVRHVRLEGIEHHNLHAFRVTGLEPSKRYVYRVMRNGWKVFEARFVAPKTGDRHRFAVVGDMGNGSVECAQIAHQIWRQSPDILAITGDVVYRRGTVGEYLSRYFPIYNSDKADLNVGAPLLRSIPTFTSVGNHDVGKLEYYKTTSFDEVPDLYAYFLYWSHPLNGPSGASRAVNMPALEGSEARVNRFLCPAGEKFPRMTNYSFDYGNVHWLVLDANAYMDWTDEEFRAWVEADLKAAENATWKLVNFHQPGFTSNVKHQQEKRMRLLSDIFERNGVNVVFCGHAHFYERTYPLRFTVEPDEDGRLERPNGSVRGQFTLDKTFDGESATRPDGVIYIVTGGGGARLDPFGTQWQKHLWKPFTHKVIGDSHSFTLCDVDGDTLVIRQLGAGGKELDRFVVSK